MATPPRGMRFVPAVFPDDAVVELHEEGSGATASSAHAPDLTAAEAYRAVLAEAQAARQAHTPQHDGMAGTEERAAAPGRGSGVEGQARRHEGKEGEAGKGGGRRGEDGTNVSDLRPASPDGARSRVTNASLATAAAAPSDRRLGHGKLAEGEDYRAREAEGIVIRGDATEDPRGKLQPTASASAARQLAATDAVSAERARTAVSAQSLGTATRTARRAAGKATTAAAPPSLNTLFSAADNDNVALLLTADDSMLATARDAHGWTLLQAAAAVNAARAAAALLATAFGTRAAECARRGAAAVARRAQHAALSAALSAAADGPCDPVAAAIACVQRGGDEHALVEALDAGARHAYAVRGMPVPVSLHWQTSQSPSPSSPSAPSSSSAGSVLRAHPAAAVESRVAPWRCVVCDVDVVETHAAHKASVGHRLREAPTRASTTAPRGGVVLTAANRGYALLVQAGWEESGGLGPTGSGQRQPVRTQLKRDRRGLGAAAATRDAAQAAADSKPRDLWRALDRPPAKRPAMEAPRLRDRPLLDGRARVSHFGPGDLRAVQDVSAEVARAAAGASQPKSRRAQLAQLARDKIKEQRLREHFREEA